MGGSRDPADNDDGREAADQVDRGGLPNNDRSPSSAAEESKKHSTTFLTSPDMHHLLSKPDSPSNLTCFDFRCTRIGDPY